MDGVGSVDSYIWRCAKMFGFFLSIHLFFFPLFFFLSNFLFLLSRPNSRLKRGTLFIIIFIITGFVGLV